MNRAIAISIFTALVSFLFLSSVASAVQTTVQPSNGGTGLSTLPGYGSVLLGNANGTYSLVSTSSLGIAASGDTGFSTTSAGYWLTQQTTSNLPEGSNLYYTLTRWSNVFAGTTTDALREGATNFYFSNARAVTALTGQNISIFNNNSGYLASLAGAASSTVLSDNNTWTGIDKFANASSDFSGTWQTFSPSHFQPALGFTPVPNTRNVNTTYPLQGGGTLSADLTLTTAFSTTTANAFNQLQQFNANASTSALSVSGNTYLGIATCNSGSDLQLTGNLVGCGNAFSTTSVAYWQSQNNFFSTTSTNYFINASSTILHPGGGSNGQVLELANGSAAWLSASSSVNIGATSTVPFMATYFVATSTTATSTFNGNFTGALTAVAPHFQFGPDPNYGYLMQDTANFNRPALNDYSAVNSYNPSNGNCATADFTVANDLMSNAAYFGDFGHTSSGFNGSGCVNNPFSDFGANSTYIFDPNGNMNWALGTSTAGTAAFKWYTGGYAAANRAMTLEDYILQIGTSTPNPGREALVVIGTSTKPQLALTDNNASHLDWTFTSIGNNFYIASSTALATSSNSALWIDQAAQTHTVQLSSAGNFWLNTSGYPQGIIGAPDASPVANVEINSQGQGNFTSWGLKNGGSSAALVLDLADQPSGIASPVIVDNLTGYATCLQIKGYSFACLDDYNTLASLFAVISPPFNSSGVEAGFTSTLQGQNGNDSIDYGLQQYPGTFGTGLDAYQNYYSTTYAQALPTPDFSFWEQANGNSSESKTAWHWLVATTTPIGALGTTTAICLGDVGSTTPSAFSNCRAAGATIQIMSSSLRKTAFDVSTLTNNIFTHNFVVLNNGNVGVGTSTPGVSFAVYTPTNNATLLQVEEDGTGNNQQAALNLMSHSDGSFLGTSNNTGWSLSARGNSFNAASQQNDLLLSYWNGSTYSAPIYVSHTGNGTTTLSGLNISGAATSTSNVGFNITSGCFAENNVCMGGVGGTSASSTLLLDNNTFGGKNVFSNASTSQFTNSGATWFTALASALLGTDLTGKLVATSSISSALLLVPNAILAGDNTQHVTSVTVNAPLTYAPLTNILGLGTVPIVNGGTATTTQVTNGVNFFDGTRITSGTALTFTGASLGINQSSPTYLLDVNGVGHFANLVDADHFVATSTTVASTFPAGIDVGTGNQVLANSTLLLYASSTNGATIFGLGAGGTVATTSPTVNGTTAYGFQAAYHIGNVLANTAFGYQSLLNATSSIDGTCIGYKACMGNASNQFGSDNTGIGFQALTSLKSGIRNTAIGSNAMQSDTTGGQNVGIGLNALQLNLIGGQDVAVGQGALGKNTSDDNTAVGYNSLLENTSGTKNVGIGREVGAGGNQTGTDNVFVGYRAGFGVAANSNSKNVFLGELTGNAVTTGSGNVFVGFQAGKSLTTGAANIVFGQNVDVASTTANGQLNIGNVIFGTGFYNSNSVLSATPVTTGHVAIGTTTPVADFQATNGGANATTTIEFGMSGQTKGTCLKLYRTDGSAIYAYVAAGATAFTLATTANACSSVTGF